MEIKLHSYTWNSPGDVHIHKTTMLWKQKGTMWHGRHSLYDKDNLPKDKRFNFNNRTYGEYLIWYKK